MTKFKVDDVVKFSDIVKERRVGEAIGKIGGYYDNHFPIVIYYDKDHNGNRAAVLHDSCLDLV